MLVCELAMKEIDGEESNGYVVIKNSPKNQLGNRTIWVYCKVVGGRGCISSRLHHFSTVGLFFKIIHLSSVLCRIRVVVSQICCGTLSCSLCFNN